MQARVQASILLYSRESLSRPTEQEHRRTIEDSRGARGILLVRSLRTSTTFTSSAHPTAPAPSANVTGGTRADVSAEHDDRIVGPFMIPRVRLRQSETTSRATLEYQFNKILQDYQQCRAAPPQCLDPSRNR